MEDTNVSKYRKYQQLTINTVDFEKALLALQEITKPIKLGVKCRVVLDYDPERPYIIIDYMEAAQ